MFRRTEYQLRGSPHSHGLYWIQNAPEFDEDDHETEQKCAEFIDKYVTVQNDKDEQMKDLVKLQMHRHTHTCYKLRGRKICRFGYPLPPMKCTRILQPLPNDVPETKRKELKQLYQNIQDELTKRHRDSKEDLTYERFLEEIGVNEEDYILGKLFNFK